VKRPSFPPQTRALCGGSGSASLRGFPGDYRECFRLCDGLEANLAAVIQRAEAAEEALRALASWGSSDADNRVKFHVGNQANVWLIDASSKVHYAGGATLTAAIMDALALANANRAA
jgi:hypothetical protein